jgi:hypothetical protein
MLRDESAFVPHYVVRNKTETKRKFLFVLNDLFFFVRRNAYRRDVGVGN